MYVTLVIRDVKQKMGEELKQELAYQRSMQPHASFRDKFYDFTPKNVIFALHREPVTA